MTELSMASVKIELYRVFEITKWYAKALKMNAKCKTTVNE